MSNYSKIKIFDIANGKGIRTSIFFSGCEFHCKGCFNRDISDFNVGNLFTREVYEKEIKPTINDHIAGISALGGEPLHPHNLPATTNLVKWFKEDFPDKNIWLWTGNTWEELMNRKDIHEVLNCINVLVDGRFIEEEKDLTLKWRGSRNQRVINVQESLKQNKVVLYED